MSPIKGELIGGIYYASTNEETGASEAPKTSKGAIYVADGAEVTINSGLISGHEALYGGAIYVENGGKLYVNGGTISNNTSRLGGAIYVEAGGTVEFTGGTITGNYAEPITGSIGGDGTAAVYAEYGATVTTPELCTIQNNISQYYGNYVVYNVDGEDIYVSTGYETSEVFDLSLAPLTYEQSCGYFSDATFMTGIEEGADYANVQQYTTNTGKTFTIVTSGLYTKTATPSKLTFTLNSGDADYNVKQIDTTTTTGVVVIPRQYDGKDVTSIGNSAFIASGLTSVVIPDSVTSIGSSAFSGCSELTSVVIPNSVTYIGSSAFYDCRGLTSVTIPDSVEYIGCDVWCLFSGDRIWRVDYGGTLEQWLRIERDTNSSVAAYPYNLYIQGELLTDVVIPDTITEIYPHTFEGCYSIRSVIVPSSVTEIGFQAFAFGNIENIFIPSSVNIIYGKDGGWWINCFADQDSLKIYTDAASKPNGWEEYWNATYDGMGTKIYAPVVYGMSFSDFENWKDYETLNSDDFTWDGTTITGYVGTGGTVVIPFNATAIAENAFKNNTTITKLGIFSGVTSIGNSAFQGCSALTEVYIGECVTSIGESCFQSSAVQKLFVGGNLKNININAFSGCQLLSDLRLSEGITRINNAAFANCKSLTTIRISSTVKYLNPWVFNGCSNLENVIFPENSQLETIYGGAFIYCAKLNNLVIPASVTSLTFNGSSVGPAFGNCLSLTTITIDSNAIAGLSSSDSSLLNYATTVYVKDTITNVGTYITESYTLQENSDKEGYKMYCRNTMLFTYNANTDDYAVSKISVSVTIGSIVIPSTYNNKQVTTINAYAFSDCTGLTSITIPDSVTSIGNGAFNGCVSINNITGPIYRESELTRIGIGNNNLQKLKITGTGTLPYNAFQSSNITSLELAGRITLVTGSIHSNQNIEEIVISGIIDVMDAYSIYQCSALKTLKVTESGEIDIFSGVRGCDALENVVLMGDINQLSSDAFRYCGNLKNINISTRDSIEFGDRVFAQTGNGVDDLNITIGERVTSIGNYAFSNSTGLTSISIPNNVISIGNYAFEGCTRLTSVIIGDGVSRIGDYAFDGCLNLCRVEIGNSIENIGTYSIRPKTDGTGPNIDILYSGAIEDWLNINFSNYWIISNWTLYINNTAITNLAIANGITEIPDWAFYFNSSLTSVTMADSVTSVGIRAFARCSSLETVTIGAGVQTVGDRAFNDCVSLEKIYIPSTVVTIINAAGTSAKGILAESSMTAYIYTDLTSQANIPAGWDQYFNYYDANTQLTVNYNVTKQQFDQM